MAQIAKELEAGTTPGIIRNIRKNSRLCRALSYREAAAAASALLPNTMGSILPGSAGFIPKYGLRRNPHLSLYSPNLIWMLGQQAYAFDSNFCRIFDI